MRNVVVTTVLLAYLTGTNHQSQTTLDPDSTWMGNILHRLGGITTLGAYTNAYFGHKIR
jgi:hypothetical protein